MQVFPSCCGPKGLGRQAIVRWQSWGNFGRYDWSRAVAGRMPSWRSRTAIETGAARRLALGNDAAFTIGELTQSALRSRRGSCRFPTESRFQRTPGDADPTGGNAPRAVFVGRLAPEKGLDTLIDAWPSVRAAYPEAQLILIGEGPERARWRIKSDDSA